MEDSLSVVHGFKQTSTVQFQKHAYTEACMGKCVRAISGEEVSEVVEMSEMVEMREVVEKSEVVGDE